MEIDIINRNLIFFFELGGVDVHITESMLATWVVAAILIVFALIVRVKLKNFKEVPSGFQNVVETLVEMISNFTKNALGEKLEFLGPYFFGVFVFILTANYIGMIPFAGHFLRPPTTDVATTLALGLMTFALIHYHGIKSRGGEYFKQYFKLQCFKTY